VIIITDGIIRAYGVIAIITIGIIVVGTITIGS
jgi:hypothetical protein